MRLFLSVLILCMFAALVPVSQAQAQLSDAAQAIRTFY